MMREPIGINFLPSEDNQPMGSSRGTDDLGEAFKILSLRLPRIQGARGITPMSNMQSPGSSGMGGGFNPQAAIFEALLRAMSGGGQGMPQPMGGMRRPIGPPQIIPGGDLTPRPGPGVPTFPTPPPRSEITDRRNPMPGNREDGAVSPFVRPPRTKGPFTY